MFKRKASPLGKERRWLFYGYKNHQEVDVILTIAPGQMAAGCGWA